MTINLNQKEPTYNAADWESFTLTEKMAYSVGALIGLVGLILSLVAAVALRGAVLLCLWDWFIISLGVPSIGLVQAIGINIAAKFVTGSGSLGRAKSDDESPDLKVRLLEWYGYPLAVLLVGYLTHLCM
jgi:hypothetical protein